MQSLRQKIKTIAIDIIGILLIILAGLTGWLPGPGGIPLLIAGLALLSINHEWAKRWLLTVKQQGLNLSDKLFKNSPKVTLLIDIVGILLISMAVYVVLFFTRSVARTAGIWLFIVALALLLGNRGRIKKFRSKR